jgi:hypothetical protein
LFRFCGKLATGGWIQHVAHNKTISARALW